MITPGEIPLLHRVFYYLRHGETTANRDAIIAGSLDVDLTTEGRAQALDAVPLVRPLGITAVYSSGLKRTRETARLVAEPLGLPVTAIPDLDERRWGELEGRPRGARVFGTTPPGAETPVEYLERVARGLAQVPALGIPLIVAHSGTYRVICRLTGHPEDREPIANCHPVRIAPNPGGGWDVRML